MSKKVGIICSSSENIDDYYKSVARSVSNYFAQEGYDLVFGGSSKSMMGICYDEFSKNNRKVYAFTTNKYADELKELEPYAGVICESTFDLKKRLFENSDIIVALPGGIGTCSEIFSFIEEKRSNNRTVPFEIYDEDGYYLPLVEFISILQLKGMADMDIENEFNISHNKDELIEHIENYNKVKGIR